MAGAWTGAAGGTGTGIDRGLAAEGAAGGGGAATGAGRDLTAGVSGLG